MMIWKCFYTDILIGLAVLLGVLSFIFFEITICQSYGYNCDLAEISPDYPPAVKEECRKARMKK
jgi:hypothetical protein